jgi:hypothetical protein
MSDDILVTIGASPATVVTVSALGIKGDAGPGFTGGAYNAGTGVITFSSTDGLGFSTADVRGITGPGFTGGSYSASTGVITFASTDGLGFSTADVRGADGADSTVAGPQGDGFTGGSYAAGTGVVTFTSGDALGFATGDLRGADSTVPGPQGNGFTGGAYNAGTGVVTFSSADGLGFATADLRGADGAGSGTVTSVATGTGLTGGPVTGSGSVALDSASIASLGLADSAQQPPAEGAFIDGDKTKLDGIDQSVSSGATPTFGIGSMTISDTSLVVADTTDLQAFVNKTDAALLKARGTGVTSSYTTATAAAGGTTFAQPAVNGEIHSDQGYFTIEYGGSTGNTVSNLTAASTYVYVDNASNLQQQTSTPTRQDWSRKMFTMRIAVDTVAGTILGFEFLNNPIGHYANSIRDIYQALIAQGVPFKGGQVITGRAGDLGFDVGSGTITEFGGTGDIDNANVLSLNAVANATYDLLERSVIAAENATDLVKFWDNAGSITALGSGTFVAHRLYRFSNGQFAIQYGQGNYANIVLARAGLLIEDYVLNGRLLNATFFGWWILGETATNTGGTTLTEFREYTIGVQGGSSSGLAGCVLKGNNGSDFLDVAAVRTNIGLGNVDNTSDADKPVSTAQQTAINSAAGSGIDPIAAAIIFGG